MTGLHDGPGLVNAHTHLYSGLAPLGMPVPSPRPAAFPELLARVWWRLDRALDEASLRAAARYHVAHALLAGTTALFDHHESPLCIEGSLDVLAAVAEELGIRALLCYGVTERNGGRDEARLGLAENARFARRTRSPLLRAAIGIHAGFTVSDATLREAGALARELDVPLHLHVAEAPCDGEDAARRGYESPIARLVACAALGPGTLLAHGVWLSAEEAAAAIRAGATFVQNPRSNQANGVGYPRGLARLAEVALGTDGFPSDMLEEARCLGDSAEALGLPTEPAARLAEGTALARRFFGPGVEGDRVRRDGARVVEVDVGGAPVVRQGTLVHGSLEAIVADAEREAARLWQRMEAIP
jgi:cytosine/adenosine deaminase-related metal-dependent hydrolase